MGRRENRRRGHHGKPKDPKQSTRQERPNEDQQAQAQKPFFGEFGPIQRMWAAVFAMIMLRVFMYIVEFFIFAHHEFYAIFEEDELSEQTWESREITKNGELLLSNT